MDGLKTVDGWFKQNLADEPSKSIESQQKTYKLVNGVL